LAWTLGIPVRVSGDVVAVALKTARPELTHGFTFVDDERDKFGLGFLINVSAKEGGRSSGALAWAGFFNAYFWVDPKAGIAGVIMSQFLPLRIQERSRHWTYLSGASTTS